MNKLPPELQFNFVEEKTDPVTEEENPNFIHEEEDIIKPDVELELPSVEKEPIDDDLIFDKQQKKDVLEPLEEKIDPIIPETPDVGGLDTQSQSPTPKKEKPVKLNKNGKPRKKRVYTEEQKIAMRERLAKARQQVGKNKAKKQEEKAKEEKYKQLKKQTRDLKIKEMEEKISPSQSKPQPKALTKEDIKEAQLEAIMSYDALRKKRKAKKKEEQMIEQHKQELKNLVKKELGWQTTAGKWSNCY